MDGQVVKILDGISEADAAKIIPARLFPLKGIIAVARQYELKDVYVPMELEMEAVKPCN